MNPVSVLNNSDNVSFNSMLSFNNLPKQEEDVWQLQKRPQESLELRSNLSADDLSSLDSWAQTTRSSVGSTDTLDSAAYSSQNTTPGESPSSTPSTRRKIWPPALKLNFDESTWVITKDKRHRHHRRTRIRQNLQAGSAKVRAVVKQGRTPEFRFRLLLLTLLGIIIAIVTFTWHRYQKQLLQLAIGDKIRFHEGSRILHLLRDDGRELVEGFLGIAIPSELPPKNCGLKYSKWGPNMCEEWKFRARLLINYTHESNLSCYNIKWESLNVNTILRDCINLRSAYWYGMGQQRHLSWPLSPTGNYSRPFITGNIPGSNFGSVLDRYWLSTDGVAVRVAPDVPLFITMKDEHLCIEAKYSGFPYTQTLDKLPWLNYTVCTGPDMRTVHETMMQRVLSLPTKMTGSEFLQGPVWTINSNSPLSQDSLQLFANQIMENAAQPGFILLDTRWQQEEGNLDFRRKTFRGPKVILRILRHKGFKVLLTVHPYICLYSSAFYNATIDQHFVCDVKSNVPLLTRYQDKVCGVVDFTNPNTSEWFLYRLQKLRNRYDIDGFFFEGGESSYLPRSYKLHQMNTNPDNFLTSYLLTAAQSSSLIGTTSGFITQNVSAFVRLSPRTSTWDNERGLLSIIPAVLTLGLLGYPLVNPGSVGGDEFFNNTSPEKELYMRWLQVSVFMPVVQLSIPPSSYGKEVLQAAHDLFKVRESLVLPAMIEALKLYQSTGIPLVRPLWWIAPNDPNAYVVDTQFVIGNNVIVCPVLEKEKTLRDVYLPPGWWTDHLLGETRRGGKWLHNYPVSLTQVAYFTRDETN